MFDAYFTNFICENKACFDLLSSKDIHRFSLFPQLDDKKNSAREMIAVTIAAIISFSLFTFPKI